ncbi:V-type ATP synthase subunit E [Natronocalculus amylovorans]|uniref:A-type ATP synthase subunit E n=1 Tax=Natronocalculus amylovorans TaxID=2917812 RepID=A0AAE3K985_9EURY|nr:V-type ATP synthase subunit E [Natronocalculus amylovorans]MCL9815789.1 V-type ATP synthase subunit E [Natronocalculus amylovorans]NUE01699.1 V-type ATP synthase subunit E [Halorubraceae archaeon YAN]
MSLETVVTDIKTEAEARAAEIREDGEDRASEIIQNAEADAEELLEERSAAIERQIEQEREQTLSSAKLEAKQARLEARRNVLEEVREQVETQLADLDEDTREELTRELLDAAAVEFEDAEHVSVYCRESDKALLESILDDYDGFEVAGTRDCLGGVVVESDESRVRVNNTFDSVLEDVWDDNLKQLSDRLFNQ